MIKPFHFLVKSVTEFAAAKAALAQHGIKASIEDVAIPQLRQGKAVTVGNYSSASGRFSSVMGNGTDVGLWGYGEMEKLGASYLPNLESLINFLESGKYKVQKFKVALTKVEIVEVEASNEEEAKAKALQTKFPVIKTSTNVKIAR